MLPCHTLLLILLLPLPLPTELLTGLAYFGPKFGTLTLLGLK